MLFVKQTFRQINFCTKIFTFNCVLGNEIDQVSPMFISEHQCKYGTQNKCLQILFFKEPN